MLRRLSIRGKVLAALSVPLLVLAVAVGLISYQSLQQANAARDVADVAKLVNPHVAVVHTLQAERAAASAFAAGQAEESAVSQARSSTDSALAKMGVALEATPEGLLGGSISDLRDTIEGLGGTVIQIRQATAEAPAAVIDGTYTSLILALAQLPNTIADQIEDQDLAPELRAYASMLDAEEFLVHESVLATAVLAADDPSPEAVGQLSGIVGTTDVAIARARDAMSRIGLGDQLPVFGEDVTQMRAVLGSGSTAAVASVDPQAYADFSAGAVEGFRTASAEVVSDIATDSEARAVSAEQRTYLTWGIALAAVVLSLIFGAVLSRQIAGPMRRLIRASGHVRDELPRLVEQVAVPGQTPDMSIAEIPVASSDEVGQLAAAFNEVNATTLRVAQEQAALRGSIAEMFVNVARRDQVLLNRQLTFIDALERSEEDPKVLADLFRLDHLATRMRRNAESLLVLAGIDTGRRLRDTLPLSDVVRTASSEIEHYERVLLDLPIDPLMLGHTALPAAHLVAELLENATMFSEPGSPVHVSTGRDDEHVLVTIIDEGLGMSPEEIESAHAKIRSSSPSEVLGAQRLGFFVVGRIAARLGAQVELSAGPNGTGTMATVRLPLVLFVDIADVPMAAPMLPPVGAQQPVIPAEPEPELVRPVDLEALTDGSTELGLPRRRTSAESDGPVEVPRPASGTIENPTLPVAPTAESLAGAAGLADEAWSPTLQESAPLTGRRAAGEPAAPAAAPTPEPGFEPSFPDAPEGLGDLPQRSLPADDDSLALPQRSVPADEGSPLPQRSAPATDQAPLPFGSAPESPLPQVPMDERTSMFTGFRSRRAAHVAASMATPEGEAASEDADAPEADTTMVIPSLEVDEDELSVATAAEPEPEPEPFVVPMLEADEEDEELPSVPAVDGAPSLDSEHWAAVDVTDEEDANWATEPPAQGEAGWTAAAPEAEQVWPPAAPEPITTPEASDEPAAAAAGPWAAPSQDFASLVQGPGEGVEAQEPAKRKKERRGLFGRRRSKKDKAAVAAAQASSLPPAPLPPAPQTSAPETLAPETSVPEPPAAPVPAAPAATPEAFTPAPVPPPAPPAPEPIAAPPAPAPAEPAPAAPAASSWAPSSWAPADAGPGNDATQVFSDLARSAPIRPEPAPEPTLPEPTPEPAPVAEQRPAAPATSWAPDPDADDAPLSHSWRLPLPGEPDWPGASASSPEPEPEPAPEPTPEPAAAPLDAARHAKPMVPSQHTSATFVPSEEADEPSTVMAQRAGIAQQALAELSQLSTYRPQSVAPAAPLTRRTPTAIPKAEPTPARKSAPRDANQVRSLLASFQSGTSRGRQEPAPSESHRSS